ncbi:MAG: hypothetical protein IJX64_07555 [Clostridia bacterium]|nr:hypothetical protein [Clostridia bacterium]
MKVEMLIYAYLAVCAAMIVFNIACIFVFRHKDKKLDDRSSAFTDKVRKQTATDEITEAHRKYLCKKLRHVNHLMAFDKTLEALYIEDPQKIKAYVEKLSAVFIYLTFVYRKKNKLQMAYFPYIIKKYQLFRGYNISIVTDVMLDLVREPALYCRENALQALYSIGDADSVIEALCILDVGAYYHHPKMITDGLLSFCGDREKLADKLWDKLPTFSERMQVSVLDYFRFCSGEYCEPILRLLASGDLGDEATYSCIRYFGKYAYEPALPQLLRFAEITDENRWEYTAITATALAIYPCRETEAILRSMLHSRNWYVRFNASQSLERQGLEYTDLVDIFEGDDRYAGEIMRYRFDQKKMREKEAAFL